MFVRARLLFAIAVAGSFSATAHAAPVPSGGTISPANPLLNYASGPFTGQNPSGQTGEDPVCAIPNTCDDYGLTVDILSLIHI